jgi:cell division GTPase FtsZ
MKHRLLTGNKFKIGFIGVGAAGCNIADVADIYGYRTACLNTSPEDLASIKLVKNKILLGSNGGAGKDRSLAKKDAKIDYRKVEDLINTKFTGVDMIFFAFSSGGGTGSGMSPVMIDVIRRLIPDKEFGCVVVLPAKNEPVVAQINTVECLKEIIRLEIPSFIADNEKMFSIYKGKSLTKKEIYDKMNDYIIDSFNLIFNTERTPSKYGNLDQQDIIKLISTPGMSVITPATLDLKDSSEENYSFSKIVMSSLDNSFFAPLEYDEHIKRSGYIYEIKSELTKYIDYDELNLEIGTPIEYFEGYYEPNDTKNTVVTILTGLSYPIGRINEIKNIINENSNKDLDDINYDSVFDDLDTSWFANARNNKRFVSLDDYIEEEEEIIEEYDEENPEDETAPIPVSKRVVKKKKKEFDIEDIFANYE